ncbi:MAG: LacI family DNA-binding transcriptional regulator [candidate division WOR-3 bacterium]|nr:LacI family DNA-binding transcriptional regulator [candidate division WOR-3 bacterium]
MERLTIRDVAHAAGVSINTVSRALSGKPDVNEETRKTILSAAEKLGYRPNKLARGLQSNKTQTVGVVITDIANPFFSALVKGVEESAREENYSIVLQDTDENYEKEKEAIQVLLAEQVDGLLITPVQTSKETIEDLKRTGLPFVLLGRHFDGLETDYVVTDDVQGGFQTTEHLIELGHKRIAMINGPLHISSAKERFQGYQKALDHYGIELDESILSAGAITTEDGYKVAKSLLGRQPQPTAVFAYSDFVAFGVMKAIREVGLEIPEDIAVMGYDDVEFSSCLEVPLTTVRIPKRELGRKAMKLLSKKIEKEKRELQKCTLKARLIPRQSTQR